uniref:Phosphoglycerate mutase n=1 Tax=Arcella intermedia TaxID=1963864 RepID=A0A6B2LEY3_9EUKA
MLVRHGETEANADKSVYKKKADHATLLSELGVTQAIGAAHHLLEFFKCNFGYESGGVPPPDWSCSIWASSYKRAVDTAQIIMDNSGGWITEKNVSVFLIEQQFGLFEGVDWSSGEVDQRFPRELSMYNKCSTFGGRFWANIPMGESRFDVCKRVYSLLNTIHKNAKAKKQNYNIIVSHGVTIRAFLMMYLGLQPEWMEECINPSNCSIRHIEKGKDKGYIWPVKDAETPLKDLLSHIQETHPKDESEQTDKPS